MWFGLKQWMVEPQQLHFLVLHTAISTVQYNQNHPRPATVVAGVNTRIISGSMISVLGINTSLHTAAYAACTACTALHHSCAKDLDPIRCSLTVPELNLVLFASGREQGRRVTDV